MAVRWGQKKQKKSDDQRPLVTRSDLIHKLRSLDVKYHLVTEGLSSIGKPYDNTECIMFSGFSSLP